MEELIDEFILHLSPLDLPYFGSVAIRKEMNARGTDSPTFYHTFCNGIPMNKERERVGKKKGKRRRYLGVE